MAVCTFTGIASLPRELAHVAAIAESAVTVDKFALVGLTRLNYGYLRSFRENTAAVHWRQSANQVLGYSIGRLGGVSGNE